MNAFIFSGPSLTNQDRAIFPQFRFEPPARQGDLLLAAEKSPDAIGLIDGYFEDGLAPHQKEILEIMSRGISVYGAASFGALRAAELEGHGMVGVGKVYRLYASAEIDCDAAVAVAHGPGELGYPSTSVSFVDVNATIDALLRRRVLSSRLARTVLHIAREIFFRDRTWDLILERLNKSDTLLLRRLLQDGHVQQKRIDAIEMLILMASQFEAGALPCQGPPMTEAYKMIRSNAFKRGKKQQSVLNLTKH